MKKILLLLGLLLTGCSTTWHVSTTGHDPIYDTVLEVPADIQIDTLSVSQLRWKLRTDFQFRYDFAQYALSQPSSFDWNNRILGNRYNLYNPYWGYGSYWNRDQMWNDWVWGFTPHRWSPFGYDRWGYNNYGWNNYGWNSWGWNNYYGNWGWRNQMNNYAWQHRNRPSTVRINGRRSNTRTTANRRVVNNNRVITAPRTRTVIKIKPRVINNKPRVVINNKPRINNSRPIPRQRVNTPIRTRSIPNTSTRSSNNTTIRSNSRRKN